MISLTSLELGLALVSGYNFIKKTNINCMYMYLLLRLNQM